MAMPQGFGPAWPANANGNNHTPHHNHGGVKGGWAWWSLMVAISVFNVALVTVVLAKTRSRHQQHQQQRWERKARRASAVVFTAVCAYRSILPRVDVPRMCFFNTPLNWVVFGRTAATVAEVCWALQMGLLVRRLGVTVGPAPLGTGAASGRVAKRAATAGYAVFWMACFAECWSWTNLITESNLVSIH